MFLQSNKIGFYTKNHFVTKAIIACFIIPLVSLIFGFSVSANTRASKNTVKEHRSNVHPETLLHPAHFSSTIPFGSVPVEQDAEIEIAEEDDLKNNSDDYGDELADKYSSEEIEYNAFLKNRFLQINTSVHKRQIVPFFILYHNWKSFLV